MNLSKQAKIDLKRVIGESYGKDFEATLSDEEVNEIGELLLNTLAESLKLKSNNKYEKENYSR